jgi:hypothetical protein
MGLQNILIENFSVQLGNHIYWRTKSAIHCIKKLPTYFGDTYKEPEWKPRESIRKTEQKIRWATWGDENTKFFHTTATQRYRKKNDYIQYFSKS